MVKGNQTPQIVGQRRLMCRTIVLASKHNVNPLNMLVHLQLLCVQPGRELGLSWRIESSSKQMKAHA